MPKYYDKYDLELGYVTADISEFIGLEFYKIEYNADERELHFYARTGEHFQMYHMQDCCEDVYLDEGIEELQELVNVKIDEAECISQDIPFAEESGTWTFYKLGGGWTRMVLRWVGFSNGYYSEGVTIIRYITDAEKAQYIGTIFDEN